jgi:leucyl/phenylalanyl-tRNA--protein transferase
MPVHLKPDQPFPPIAAADRFGLLAIGDDLSPDRLVEAYSRGIFPWGGAPVQWYSPDPRCVVVVEGAFDRLPRRLRRLHRQQRFAITVDRAFDRVIRGCASPAPGREETWLTPEMIRAYERLHARGVAHSVESWREDRLVGGLYGVALGGYFSGESMFSKETDASKVAFAGLLEHLDAGGYALLDCQVPTRHLLSLGAIIVTREDFLNALPQVQALPAAMGQAPAPAAAPPRAR